MPTEFFSAGVAVAPTSAPPQPDDSSVGVPEKIGRFRAALSTAADRRQAYEIVLDELGRHAEVLDAVHWSVEKGSRENRVVSLRQTAAGDSEIQPPNELNAVCEKVLASRQIHYRQKLSPHRIVVGVPIDNGTGGGEVLGLVLAHQGQWETLITAVDRAGSGLSAWQLARRVEHQRRLAERSAAVVELVTHSLRGQHQRETCQTLVTEIARHLNLPRVAIGLRSRRSDRCRLVALSDSTRIDRTAARTRRLEHAMDETCMFGQTLSARDEPGDDSGEGIIGQATSALAREQAAGVVAVPLHRESPDQQQTPAGVVVAFTDDDADLQSIENFLLAAGPCLASVLDASEARGPGWIRRILRACRSRAAVVALAACLIFGAAMGVPVPHRESCDILVEPNQKRYVAAPFEATLKECFVAPGDMVQQGDLLARLDGRELRLRRDGLQADYDRAIKKRDAAQATGVYAESRIAQLDADRLKSELDLVDLRLAELELRSPVDGIIVSGDLQRAKGAPLETGQSLFEIAPLDAVLIEVAIPDDRMMHIRAGQEATFRLNAYPDQKWTTELMRIHPRSEIRDEANVFIAECVLPNEQQQMRPGMKGSMRIECGHRRLAWVLFHRPLEAIQRWVWW